MESANIVPTLPDKDIFTAVGLSLRTVFIKSSPSLEVILLNLRKSQKFDSDFKGYFFFFFLP